MHQRVLIIGGGLAGLAAATALAPRGFRVTVVESKARLGGRASSFQDPVTGQLIDACQHVSMGCCTNFAYFVRTLGIAHLLEPQKCLYFMTPDRRISRFQAGAWPAPFHLMRSFIAAHYLSPLEKLRVAWGLDRLRRADDADDPPFADWLRQHGQTPRIVDRFWGLVLVSALNETPDRVGLRYARKVFVDAFLTHPRGFEVEVPRVPLGRLYGQELTDWLANHGVELRLLHAGRQFMVENGRISRLDMRLGPNMEAEWYISAVPFDRLLDLLPAETIDADPYFANLRKLETSPITSVHAWFDEPATTLPHVVVIDSISQWVFNRGEVGPGEHYLQVVVSAARQLRGLGREEVERRVVEELRRLFPPLASAMLLRAKVVTEHAATFSAVPGVDRWRPVQASPIANLFLAGDWTRTGWPATMEGAVRSGYLAAEAVLTKYGRPQRLLQPDLQ